MYRQAEFGSAEELERELRRLEDSEDFAEIVGYDATETPFMAFLALDDELPPSVGLVPHVVVLEGQGRDEMEVQEADTTKLAYPVRTLTRPGESIGKR